MKSSQMAHLDVHRFTVFDDVAILHQGRGQVRHVVVARHTTGDIPSVDHKPWKLRDRGCHWISNVSGSPTKVKMNSKLFQKQRPHVVPFASLAKLVICEMCYQMLSVIWGTWMVKRDASRFHTAKLDFLITCVVYQCFSPGANQATVGYQTHAWLT